MFDTMPVQASEWAASVDWINNFITNVSIICIFAITAAMLYFAWKYRHSKSNPHGAYVTHNVTIETVWTVIPSVVCIAVFVYGFVVYKDMRTPPANPIEISVEGFKWGWNFGYESGRRSSTNLVVPVGQPVRLVMTSRDYIHSFFIPAMRVKEDLYRGNYSYLWFTPTKEGEFHIFCTEYCGTGHSEMRGKLRVVSQEEYEDFLLDREDQDAPSLPPAVLGEQLYKENACVTCHSLDGSAGIGPSFKGLFARGTREFTDGTTATVDENYVRQSILEPASQIVKGFENGNMPSFAATLKDKDIEALIAFIKEQK